MNTEYGPRNPERDVDRQWESEDIIETKDMNRIENQVRMLTNHTIWDDELGDTIQRDSEPPRKINVKEMSSTTGGITPTPPTTNQDKSILFADGYNQINVTSSIDNTNNKQDFVINRSSDTSNLASFSIGAASTSNIGLMSSTDKSHLDTIWNGELQSNATIVTSNNINSITGLITTSNFTDQLQNIGVVSTTANGLAPQLANDNTKFLNGTGGWSVPTGTYSHPTGGANTPVGPTSAVSPGFGGTVDIPYISINNLGHTTTAVDRTLTIPSTVATTSNNGLMSSGYVTSLNNIASRMTSAETNIGNIGKSATTLWNNPNVTSNFSTTDWISFNDNVGTIYDYKVIYITFDINTTDDVQYVTVFFPTANYYTHFITVCNASGDWRRIYLDRTRFYCEHNTASKLLPHFIIGIN